jgi:hypothetical protein
MGNPLKPLLEEIQDLEKIVADKIQQTADHWPFDIQEGRIVFDPAVRKQHRQQMQRLLQYLRESSLMAIVTAPVIYSLLLPIAMLDLFVSLFQTICFRVYSIPRVARREFLVIDRHHLAYLNWIEKVNCVYCGYANGVLAYAREIASRTEQYWCPIKHARRVKGCHSRQCLFCDYGDAEGFRREFDELRQRFSDIE